MPKCADLIERNRIETTADLRPGKERLYLGRNRKEVPKVV